MIIHPAQLKINGKEICVSAEIEFAKHVEGAPATLWFAIPVKYKNWISDNADGFVVSLLLPAMAYGENMDVRGCISPRLAYNIKEFQRISNFWYPKKYKVVEIHAKTYAPEQARSKNVLCAFSGGVDSFYTLFSHLPKNEPLKEHQITHALFAHGLDIPLEDEKTYETALGSYDELMRELGIELVPIRTNIKRFHQGIDWNWSNGSALAGIGLTIGQQSSRFYFAAGEFVPGSFSLPQEDRNRLLALLMVEMSNAPLLSTETLNIVYHGLTVSRPEKIRIISQYPETYNRLRVCWEHPEGLKNCCRCNKCIGTMIPLHLFGALHKYTTFPLLLSRALIRKCLFPIEMFNDHKRNLDFAIKSEKKNMAFDLRCALFLNKSILWKNALIRRLKSRLH